MLVLLVAIFPLLYDFIFRCCICHLHSKVSFSISGLFSLLSIWPCYLHSTTTTNTYVLAKRHARNRLFELFVFIAVLKFSLDHRVFIYPPQKYCPCIMHFSASVALFPVFALSVRFNYVNLFAISPSLVLSVYVSINTYWWDHFFNKQHLTVILFFSFVKVIHGALFHMFLSPIPWKLHNSLYLFLPVLINRMYRNLLPS